MSKPVGAIITLIGILLVGVGIGAWWWQKPYTITAVKLPIPPEDVTLITDIISNEQNGLIVTERRGRVLEVIPTTPPRVRVIADLQTRVWNEFAEYGLYSVALGPDYRSNGWLYLSFANRDGDLEVGRYRESDGRYEMVLVVPQPRVGEPLIDSTHKGGQLAFWDGALYIATGDGGTRHPPQDNLAYSPTSLLGKILRIEVEQNSTSAYSIPADNPFVGDTGVQGEVWATGLRNPWKFTFDTATGDLYISDVGDTGYEEINLVSRGNKGVDFGWNCTEGQSYYYNGDYCQTRSYTPPIYAYPTHATIAGRTHCAVTGGEVMRSIYYPSLWGSYIYGDICAARLYRLRYDKGAWVNSILFDFTNLQEDLVTAIGSHNGILYVANHKGDIYEIQSN